jgi:hypothetical protein
MKSEDGLFTHKVIHCFQQVLVVRCCFFAPFTVQSREPYDPRNGLSIGLKAPKNRRPQKLYIEPFASSGSNLPDAPVRTDRFRRPPTVGVGGYKSPKCPLVER